MVSALAFYYNHPSLNPAGYLNVLYKRAKINEKEAEDGPSVFSTNILAFKSRPLFKQQHSWKARFDIFNCQKMGRARQDSNPRLTGEKLESYLSAVPPAFTAENKIKSTGLLSAMHSNFLFGDTAMPAFYLGVLPHFR